MDNTELLAQIAQLLEQMDESNRQRFTRLEVMIENDVSKQIGALFDGYQLAHEQQWELERKLQSLDNRVDASEIKAG